MLFEIMFQGASFTVGNCNVVFTSVLIRMLTYLMYSAADLATLCQRLLGQLLKKSKVFDPAV